MAGGNWTHRETLVFWKNPKPHNQIRKRVLECNNKFHRQRMRKQKRKSRKQENRRTSYLEILSFL
jgi:hypothetical protein